MSVETRHTEKNILFKLLRAETVEDYQEVTSNLMATMEPEDVQLVKQEIAELKQKRGASS